MLGRKKLLLQVNNISGLKQVWNLFANNSFTGRVKSVFARPIKPRKGKPIMKRIAFYFTMISLMFAKAYSQAPIPVEGWPYITRCLNFGEWVPRLSLEQGQMHLYFDARTGEVDKFELNGAFSPGWPLLLDSVIWRQPPIILDIDHDGLEEMLCPGWGNAGGQNRYSLYLFDNNGAVMSGFPVYMGFLLLLRG